MKYDEEYNMKYDYDVEDDAQCEDDDSLPEMRKNFMSRIIDEIAEFLFGSVHVDLKESNAVFVEEIKEKWKSLVKIDICRELLHEFEKNDLRVTEKKRRCYLNQTDIKEFRDACWEIVTTIQEADYDDATLGMKVLKIILKNVRKENGSILFTDSENSINGGNCGWYVQMERFLKRFSIDMFSGCENIAYLWAILNVFTTDELKEKVDCNIDIDKNDFLISIEKLLQLKKYRKGKRVNEALDFLYEVISKSECLQDLDNSSFVVLLETFQYHDHMIEKLILEGFRCEDEEEVYPWKTECLEPYRAPKAIEPYKHCIEFDLLDFFSIYINNRAKEESYSNGNLGIIREHFEKSIPWVKRVLLRNTGEREMYRKVRYYEMNLGATGRFNEMYVTVAKEAKLARIFQKLVHGYISFLLQDSSEREAEYVLYRFFSTIENDLKLLLEEKGKIKSEAESEEKSEKMVGVKLIKDIENADAERYNDEDSSGGYFIELECKMEYVLKRINCMIADIILSMGIKKKNYHEVAEIELVLRLMVLCVNRNIYVQDAYDEFLRLLPYYSGEKSVWKMYEESMITALDYLKDKFPWDDDSFNDISEILLESIEPLKFHL